MNLLKTLKPLLTPFLGPKGAPWKAAIALHLKQTTSVQNRWLADQLHMGRRDAVSCYLARLKAAGLANNRDYQKLTTNVST